MNEPAKLNPPEILEPADRLRIVEFVVDLSDMRPELQLLTMVRSWLRDQAPLTVVALICNYQPSSEQSDAPVLIGQLIVGAPLDLG